MPHAPASTACIAIRNQQSISQTRTALAQRHPASPTGRTPVKAAGDMLHVIDGLTPQDSGRFYAYDGTRLPW